MYEHFTQGSKLDIINTTTPEEAQQLREAGLIRQMELLLDESTKQLQTARHFFAHESTTFDSMYGLNVMTSHWTNAENVSDLETDDDIDPQVLSILSAAQKVFDGQVWFSEVSRDTTKEFYFFGTITSRWTMKKHYFPIVRWSSDPDFRFISALEVEAEQLIQQALNRAADEIKREVRAMCRKRLTKAARSIGVAMMILVCFGGGYALVQGMSSSSEHSQSAEAPKRTTADDVPSKQKKASDAKSSDPFKDAQTDDGLPGEMVINATFETMQRIAVAVAIAGAFFYLLRKLSGRR